MDLPNPQRLMLTRGVCAAYPTRGQLEYLISAVCDEYRKQPDRVTDGGNDKFFFSFTIDDRKLFAAANELGGLTIMFPEEY